MKTNCIFCILLISCACFGQIDSTTTTFRSEKPLLSKKSIIPASLMLSGILLSGSNFEKNLQRDLRNKVGNDFSYPIDNYTRFAPIAQLYIADIAGVPSKNHWFDQTKNLIISVVITQAITGAMKKSIFKLRPNEFNADAFPSGHTSHAFANASVLYEEFKESSPLLAYSGYAFATTTGTFRMLNNKHWLSDVLVGAGLGIAVTKLVYHFDYLFSWNPFKKSKDTVLTPTYNGSAVGFYFSKQF